MAVGVFIAMNARVEMAVAARCGTARRRQGPRPDVVRRRCRRHRHGCRLDAVGPPPAGHGGRSRRHRQLRPPAGHRARGRDVGGPGRSAAVGHAHATDDAGRSRRPAPLPTRTSPTCSPASTRANPVVTVWQNGKLVGMVPPKKPPRTPRRIADTALTTQASATCQSRFATGGLSLHGKLIQRSVRLHT